MFKKLITAAVATAVIATASITAPTQAEAHGHGIGLGIAAGLITGAVVGTAIVNSQQPRYYYEDDYVSCHNVRVVDDYGHTYLRRVCR